MSKHVIKLKQITELQKGIPIPKPLKNKKRSDTGESKYPLRKMKVGHSFGIKYTTSTIKTVKHSITSMNGLVRRLKAMKLLPKTFKLAARTLKKEVRFWRTK